MIQVSAVGNK